MRGTRNRTQLSCSRAKAISFALSLVLILGIPGSSLAAEDLGESEDFRLRSVQTATIRNIEVEGGTLDPAFSASAERFRLTLAEEQENFSLTVTPQDASETGPDLYLDLGGAEGRQTLRPGEASQPVSMALGQRRIVTVSAISQNGEQTREYPVEVYRTPVKVDCVTEVTSNALRVRVHMSQVHMTNFSLALAFDPSQLALADKTSGEVLPRPIFSKYAGTPEGLLYHGETGPNNPFKVTQNVDMETGVLALSFGSASTEELKSYRVPEGGEEILTLHFKILDTEGNLSPGAVRILQEGDPLVRDPRCGVSVSELLEDGSFMFPASDPGMIHLTGPGTPEDPVPDPVPDPDPVPATKPAVEPSYDEEVFLSQLALLTHTDRKLIRRGVSPSAMGFDSTVTDYDLYALTTDSDSLRMEAVLPVASGAAVRTRLTGADGYLRRDWTAVELHEYAHDPDYLSGIVEADASTSGALEVEVTVPEDSPDSAVSRRTVYVIRLHKNGSEEEDPAVFLQMIRGNPTTNSGGSDLGTVYFHLDATARNLRPGALQFTLDMTPGALKLVKDDGTTLTGSHPTDEDTAAGLPGVVTGYEAGLPDGLRLEHLSVHRVNDLSGKPVDRLILAVGADPEFSGSVPSTDEAAEPSDGGIVLTEGAVFARIWFQVRTDESAADGTLREFDPAVDLKLPRTGEQETKNLIFDRWFVDLYDRIVLKGGSVTVKGTILAYNPNEGLEPVVSLIRDGVVFTTSAAVLETPDNPSRGIRKFLFEIDGVPEGVYDLRAEKFVHLPVTVKNLTVSSVSGNILDLSQVLSTPKTGHGGRTGGSLRLPCGDVDQDGLIKMSDRNVMLSEAMFGKAVETLETFGSAVRETAERADLDGDGWIRTDDLHILMEDASFGKGAIVIGAGQ